MQLHDLLLNQLEPHPNNTNVMSASLFEKLMRHIEQTGQYPPLIVRPLFRDHEPTHAGDDTPDPDTPRYQLIDGHHRARALEKLGRATARCVIWHVDDEQTLMLLATLNRLEGRDDPHKRADLLKTLHDRKGLDALRASLPEKADQLKHLLQAQHAPPAPAAPTPREDMPEAVHFFLYPRQRRALERALRQYDTTREQALLRALNIQTSPAPTSPRQ